MSWGSDFGVVTVRVKPRAVYVRQCRRRESFAVRIEV